MNRRTFLTSAGAALGLMSLGRSRAVAAGGAEAEGLADSQITPAMRSTHPQRLAYNHPGLLTDLGVGLWGWPMPMDYNGDGRMDLIVTSSGTPYNGVYFFENTGEFDPQTKAPVFKRGVRLGKAVDSPRVSYVDGKPVVATPGFIYPDFLKSAFDQPVKIPAPSPQQIRPTGSAGQAAHWNGAIRSSQWHLIDYRGRGVLDLIIGIDDWSDYNWDGAFKGTDASAFDAQGKWKYGPLHGWIYLLPNTGTNEAPVYGQPELILAGDKPIDVYGRPCPCFGDFRGTGKLDLICGEFLDGFTFFENVGSRTEPRYAPGRRLQIAGADIAMDLCMIAPAAANFLGSGHLDLLVGDEDGRIALVEHTGRIVDGMPQFLAPRYLKQHADELKFGALSAPAAYDLDGDGQPDLICGDSAGYIGFIKNLGGTPPRWAAPVYLAGGDEIIRIQAGYNGDCQGPSETKWGYTNVSVADWDGDGLADIMCSDVWGKVYWYRNVGTKTAPAFGPAQAVTVEWDGPTPKPAWNWWSPAGQELVTQWRCTPCMIDWNRDGLMDLVMVDHEGYLALFERRKGPDGRLQLLPGKRVFWGENVSEFDQSGRVLNHQPGLLRLNATRGGASGRRTYCFTHWTGGPELDLLVNSVNISLLRGLGRNQAGLWSFRHEGPLSSDRLAGHSTCPTMIQWKGAAAESLVFGAEDGFFYHLDKPHQA